MHDEHNTGTAANPALKRRARHPMTVLLETDAVRVSASFRGLKSVILCFTGVGHALGGVDIQGEEFTRVSANADTIYIIDKKRSWGNNLNFAQLTAVIGPHVQGRSIHALGNSMGGFLAVVFSKYFPIETVIAFDPQYSVSDIIVPNEKRWRKYVKNINSFSEISLENCFVPKTQYYILSTDHPTEKEHWGRIKPQENIHKIIFSGQEMGHTIARHLKSKDVLYDVIGACLSHCGPERIFEVSAGRSLEAPSCDDFLHPEPAASIRARAARTAPRQSLERCLIWMSQ